MRHTVEEARALLEEIPVRDRSRRVRPPTRPGFQPGDLRGLRSGSLKVVGFLVPDEVSPWWIVRCVKCGEWDVARGCALRSGSRVTCLGCFPVVSWGERLARRSEALRVRAARHRAQAEELEREAAALDDALRGGAA